MRQVWTVAVFLCIGAHAAPAQVVSAGLGVSYYCIVSRCDTGTILNAAVAFDLGSVVSIEAGHRRHSCFDCHGFGITEGLLQLRYARTRLQPFVGAGVAHSVDREFMGSETGLMAAAGVWLWPRPDWGLRLELRGRQAGRGDSMGELTLSVARRFIVLDD